MTDLTFDEYDPTGLPASVAAFEVALDSRDAAAALPLLATDVEVTDEGRTYTGPDGVTAWLASAASQYTYTTAYTGQQVDGERVVVRTHLEGNFPGGVADLYHRYTVLDGRIARLVIES
jgi:hypothetical protein